MLGFVMSGLVDEWLGMDVTTGAERWAISMAVSISI
jgi:hypothetical protein